MATSRSFNGSTDRLDYTGTGPECQNVAHSLLIVCKLLQSDGTWASLIEMEGAAGAPRPSIGRRNNDQIYYSNDNGLDSAVSFTSADGWCIIAATKPAGTNEPTLHKIPVGGSRTSTIASNAAITNQTSSGVTVVRLAGNDDPANVEIAAAAIWAGVELTTGQLDGIRTALTSASILALSPNWMADASDALATDVTAGTVDKTAGTSSAGASDPAGWVYLGGATPSIPNLALQPYRRT